EEGVALQRILGTKHVNDTADLSVQFRRHCRYSLRSTYTGKGNSSDPDGWKCK
ncbi:hypothetical protein F5050DRAFT_1574970, partial [Lentinula boryana]